MSNNSTRAIRQRLEDLQRAGITHLPCAVPAAVTTDAPSLAAPQRATPTESVTTTTATTSPANESTMAKKKTSSSSKTKDPAAQLAILQKKVAACTRCKELSETRTQTVFGTGTPTPRLVFLGEAPGADEDRQGEPFVGRAGKLLTKIIEACTLTRDEVYILNILKCRPPGNRNPSSEESDACREWLNTQLDILKPEFICCLGAVAAHNLLETETPIGRMRGKFYEYHGSKVLCTYHPAYLLRNPAAKAPCWDDMQLLMKEMGIKIK